jgi:glycosyltransferase involved in cell wall biosynthesis
MTARNIGVVSIHRLAECRPPIVFRRCNPLRTALKRNLDLSVIITYFNEGELLLRAIESIETQVFVGILEIILVDDASLIPPPRLKPGKWPIRYIRTDENRGPACARNRGIAEATGDYVSFLDADDVYTPGRVSDHLNFLKAETEVVFVCSPYRYVHEGKSYLISPAIQGTSTLPGGTVSAELSRHAFCTNYTVHTASFTARRDAILRVGGFSTDLCCWEEWDLVVRLSQSGATGYTSVPAMEYLNRPSNTITSTINPRKQISGAIMRRRWRKTISNLPFALRSTLRKQEAELWLLAGQIYCEQYNDPITAIRCAISSIFVFPTIWGIRSSVRYGINAILSELRSCCCLIIDC